MSLVCGVLLGLVMALYVGKVAAVLYCQVIMRRVALLTRLQSCRTFRSSVVISGGGGGGRPGGSPGTTYTSTFISSYYNAICSAELEAEETA